MTRGIFILTSAAIGLSCSPPPEPPPCKLTPTPVGEFGFVDRATTLKLQVDATCPAGRFAPRVKTFSTAVYDPANKPVPHTTLVDPNATGVIVSFTSSRAGSHYLTATLDDIGTVQGTVSIVGVGGDGGSISIDWPQHPNCDGLDLTANGTVVCFRDLDGGAIAWSTHREGIPDSHHSCDSVVLDGDHVWELDEKQLRGWLSEDAGLRLLHEIEVPLLYEPRFPNQPALASSQGLPWVFANMRLISGTAEPDGGLGLELRDVYGPDGGPIGFPGALVASDEEVMMMTCAPLGCIGFVLDGPMPAGVTTGSMLAGTERGLVWTASEGRLEAFGPEVSNATVAAASLPLKSALVQKSRAGVLSNVALLRLPTNDVAVPRLVGGNVLLELFDAGTEFERVSAASTHHIFAWSKDGLRLRALAR